MNLNTDTWEKFRVGKLFRVGGVKKYSAIPKDEGNVPFISSTSQNNGVAAKINGDSIDGNCLTVSTNGACFDVFYQRDRVAISSDVEVLYMDRMNLALGMFLSTILRMEQYKYSYGRKPKGTKVRDTVIKLPIKRDSHGNPILDPDKKYSENGYIPDFEFMENYIKSLNHKPITTKNTDRNNLSLDIGKWKRYKIADLFEVRRGRRLKAEDRLPGNVAYFSASEFNNGKTDSISNPLFVESNALIYSTFGDAYYVEGEFTASDEISILKVDRLNKYVGIFLSTVLQKNKYKYAYGRKAFQNKFLSEYVELPTLYEADGITPVIDPDKTYSENGYIPDFEFMEKYIRALPYGDRI